MGATWREKEPGFVVCTLYSVTGQPPDTYTPLTAIMECICVIPVSTRPIYENYPHLQEIGKWVRKREMSDWKKKHILH